MFQYINSYQGISKEEKIFSFLAVFMALFHVYKIPSIPVSIGEFLLFICIPLYYKRKMELPFERHEIGFILYFCYMTFSSLILGIVFDVPISKYFSIARVGFYWILIFYFGKNLVNRMFFEKWMIVFSMILSAFVIFQWSVYLFTGYFIPGQLTVIPINRGESFFSLYEHSIMMATWMGFIRPNGFLLEPAQVSQFLCIGITTLICNKKILFKNKVQLLFLFSIAVLLTQSTTGLVLLGLASLLFMSIEKKLSVYRLPLIFSFIAIGFYVLYGASASNNSSTSIERVANILTDSNIDGSSNARLFNGMNLFSEIPFVFKLFGTGVGLSGFVINSLNFYDAITYMNALARIFFSSGVIGGFLWIISLIVMFMKSGLLGKSLVVVFFITTLGCSIFCQPQMVWFFLLILADIKEKNDRYSRFKLQ